MNKRIKTAVLFSSIIFFSAVLSAQDMGQLEWLSSLDSKSSATYGDAVKLFAYQAEGKSSNFTLDSAALGRRGLALDGYSESEELSRGMLAKMTARYLDLGGSLMYIIFKTERYAFRACVAGGIMRGDGSENDLISGPELVEVMNRISEVKGGR